MVRLSFKTRRVELSQQVTACQLSDAEVIMHMSQLHVQLYECTQTKAQLHFNPFLRDYSKIRLNPQNANRVRISNDKGLLLCMLPASTFLSSDTGCASSASESSESEIILLY